MTKVTWEMDLEDVEALTQLLFELDVDEKVSVAEDEELQERITDWINALHELIGPHEDEEHVIAMARIDRHVAALTAKLEAES